MEQDFEIPVTLTCDNCGETFEACLIVSVELTSNDNGGFTEITQSYIEDGAICSECGTIYKQA